MWAYTNDDLGFLSTVANQPSLRFQHLRHARLVPRWVRRWFQREATRVELNRLSPTMLADIGINRGDFPAIIDGTFARGK